MTTKKSYQSLHENKIFVGGSADVEAMIKNENIDVIVDLRAEATKMAYPSETTQWIQVPIGDDSPQTEEILFKKAIDEVVSAYKAGKTVGFHCAGGRGRAGTVAIGTLLALGLSNTLQEAEQKAKSIRSIINIGSAQRESLHKIFPDK
ncbi:MAG: protein tyrosine phosphatase [Bacilli bacterium]|nr:protein tyrosine phosphatase [Bacilli bacterium]